MPLIPRHKSRLANAIGAVVRSQRCTGCGACAQLDQRVQMSRTGGFMRPGVDSSEDWSAGDDRAAAASFNRICPGVRVHAGEHPGAERHPILGPVHGIWAAWATDSATRHLGSSGGTLTALAAWMVEEGHAHQVTGARSDQDPRKTVSVSITTKEQALASAGSRYAPCSNAAMREATNPAGAFIGKPCEATALRALANDRAMEAPLLLSFFCAGTPNQDATHALVRELGIPDAALLKDLWYRGRGWPGSFTAVPEHGNAASTSYKDSWGRALGPTVQWRCRICPDGVGEMADITAGDFWRADEEGYPNFSEGEGVSVLIARSARGLNMIQRAADDGVIQLRAIGIDDVLNIQPYQVQRRRYLLGRLLGTLVTGMPVPIYKGFGLARFTLRSPRRVWHEFRGTVQRRRAMK